MKQAELDLSDAHRSNGALTGVQPCSALQVSQPSIGRFLTHSLLPGRQLQTCAGEHTSTAAGDRQCVPCTQGHHCRAREAVGGTRRAQAAGVRAPLAGVNLLLTCCHYSLRGSRMLPCLWGEVMPQSLQHPAPRPSLIASLVVMLTSVRLAVLLCKCCTQTAVWPPFLCLAGPAAAGCAGHAR